MKHRAIIAGIPVQVSETQIYDMEGSLVSRAKSYFGKNYSKIPFANMITACYIDNYLSMMKFIDDEEERRNMAWEFTKNSNGLEPEAIRPDLSVQEIGITSNSQMKIRMNKLLDKFQNGWTTLRYLMNLEKHEKFTIREFFDEVIVKNDIEHEIKKSFKGNVLIDVNIIDFCEKYYCKKYSISFEDLDI